jgi:NhaP-type Na+/H+ or K+/H+ antiporter
VASTKGPGAIAVVHRVTITTAFVGALAFTAWAAAQRNPAAALGGIAAAVVVGLYLRNLRARLDEKLTPRRR